MNAELSDDTIRSATASVPDHVAHRTFGEETVALNLQTGRYHGLNETATAMLEALSDGDSIQSTAARLAAEFGEPQERIETDLIGLCRSLSERGLLELHAPQP